MAQGTKLQQLKIASKESFERALQSARDFNQKLDILAQRMEALQKEEARRYETMMREDNWRHEQLLELIMSQSVHTRGEATTMQDPKEKKELIPILNPAEKRVSSLINFVIDQPASVTGVEQKHHENQQMGDHNVHDIKLTDSASRLEELPRLHATQPSPTKPIPNVKAPNIEHSSSKASKPRDNIIPLTIKGNQGKELPPTSHKLQGIDEEQKVLKLAPAYIMENTTVSAGDIARNSNKCANYTAAGSAITGKQKRLQGLCYKGGEEFFSGRLCKCRIFNTLQFLYYTMVSVGMPCLMLMVALDTGSDLLWLPCDCSSCAPASSTGYGLEFESSFYSPNMSLTSQRVPCSDGFCEHQNECSETVQCPYKIIYVSAETSYSDFLVEDDLYLTKEDAHPEIVEAQIVFGCGQVQIGSFLDAVAPNGLLGLAMEKISVPSILASRGLTSDSFSMCFGRDSFGRFSFGDQGSLDQEETPLCVNPLHPTYNITITDISVENSSLNLDISTLFDTGTSFTYLADPAYSFLAETFDAQVPLNRYATDSRIPFEHCYSMSSNDTKFHAPNLRLITEGGSLFPVSEPGIVISIQQHEYIYCLAVVRSNKLNIIGQNFMTGLRVVFDRERKILGWKMFNCYDMEESSSLTVNSHNSSVLSPLPRSYPPESLLLEQPIKGLGRRKRVGRRRRCYLGKQRGTPNSVSESHP